MGKAKKQHANKIKKQITNNTQTKEFQQMVEAMEDDKNYQIKKNKGYLFDGRSLTGKQWKAMFLKPKSE